MNVLYLTQYFPPEAGASQQRAAAMARGIAARGHRVTVVCEVPNHPAGVVRPGYGGAPWRRSTEDGIEVLRTWVRPSREKTFGGRLLHYGSFAVTATAASSLAVRGRVDVVLATSPPLTVGAVALLAAAIRRAPLVFEVRDPWPRAAVELGALRPGPALAAALRLEAACYRRARRVVVVTEGARGHVVARGAPPDRVACVPNGAHTGLFRFLPGERARVRRELGWEGRFVVLFGGLHGLAQPLHVALEAASLLRGHPAAPLFAFAGEGPRKAALVEAARARSLPDVVFLPERSREEMPALLSACDVAMALLADVPFARITLPVKVFDAWACARAVVVGAAGEAADLVASAGGGVAVPPEDPAALAAAIADLAGRPAERDAMGARGRARVEADHDIERNAARMAAILEETVPGAARSQAS